MSERRTFNTASPRPGYGADIMRVHVEDGRIVGIEGAPDDRAARGELTRFAQRYIERVYSEDRLLTPLLRKGEPGGDEFEAISWDDALSRVAEELTTIAKEQDPRALLYHAGHGRSGVMGQFGPLFLSYYGGYSSVYGDLCHAAGMEATRLTFGALHHHPPDDYVNAKMVVLWGKNPAVTNPHQMSFLLEAQKQGTKLVCIDPRRTKTAALCDRHVQPKPGTDGFLANAMGHALIEAGLVDEDFIASHVLGFEDYRWMVRNYGAAKASETCGLPADEIRAFAQEFGETRPCNINVGFGVQRCRNGGQTVRAIAALQAITGNIGVHGGGFDYFNQAAYVMRPYPFNIPAPPRVRQIGSVGRIGRSILTAKDPAISAAIIERANPMTQVPFTSAVHYALTRLEFLCVIDQFLTDTARRAHIVLPAPTMFEQLDVHAGLWHGVLHLVPKCIESPGEVKTERDIYRALATKLGYPTDQFDIEPEQLINSVLPPGLSVNRLKKQPFDRRGPEFVPFSDHKFPTPSGKIELRCEAAEVSWHVDPLPFYTPPRESEQNDMERFKRFPLHLITPKSEGRFNSQWALDPELAELDGPLSVTMNPADAADRGLKEGDTARVFNDRGEVRAAVKFDIGALAGVVEMPQGRWVSTDGFSVNVLTHDDLTDMGYGTIYFDCLVEIEPSAGASGA
ncbi:MAG: molybdopterin-containing oxidoreductase family protein [Planctomycetota bacterium]